MRGNRWPTESARLAGLVVALTVVLMVLGGAGPAGAVPAQAPAILTTNRATNRATNQATNQATNRATPSKTTNDVTKTKQAAARADAAASRARAKVDALLDRYQAASDQVNDGVRDLSAAFAAGASADVDHEQAAAQQRRARAAQSAQVRAVYAAGGGAGLSVSVLGAASPDDALWRASTADRVMTTLLADTRDQVTVQTAVARTTRRRAIEADRATTAQAAALATLQRRAEEEASTLNQAQQTLDQLDTAARQATAARESARQIAAAQAAAAEAARKAMGTVTALGIPAEYQQTYRAAALTCPGMRWTLLAGVGQVETGHGRNNRPSSVGALGPMQFMPRTFAAYGVDGDHDGVLNVWDPEDAIFSAAHYLCVSGAEGGSAEGVHAALLAYNHAEWYVDLVLAAEQAIIAREAANAAP